MPLTPDNRYSAEPSLTETPCNSQASRFTLVKTKCLWNFDHYFWISSAFFHSQKTPPPINNIKNSISLSNSNCNTNITPPLQWSVSKMCSRVVYDVFLNLVWSFVCTSLILWLMESDCSCQWRMMLTWKWRSWRTFLPESQIAKRTLQDGTDATSTLPNHIVLKQCKIWMM